MRATPDFELIVTVTSARKDVGTLDEQHTTLKDLEETCTKHEIGEKDGTALIPAEFGPCTEPCRNVTKGSGWDCGGGAIHRLSANVLNMTALGLDVDDVSDETMRKIDALLDARGLYYVCWSTHSHRLPEPDGPLNVCRLRLLFPFAEPMKLVNPQQWSAVAWPALVGWLGLPLGTDFSCRNPDRIYYLPRIASEASPHFACVNQGELLDWKQVPGLVEALAANAVVRSVPVALAPEEDPTRPIDMEAIREGLKRIRTNPYLTNLLKKEPLELPPGPDRAPGASRREAWRKVTADLANYVEGWESTESLLDEILRPSWRAEVAQQADPTAWETIVTLFAGARASAPSYKAEKAARQAARTELLRASIRFRHEHDRQEQAQRAELGPGGMAKPEAEEQREPSAEQPPTAPRPPAPDRATTDIGNAERFSDQHRGGLLHVYARGAWFAYDGKRWADAPARAHMAAQETAKSILGEASAAVDPERIKKLAAWGVASQSAKSVAAMLNLARPHLAAEHDALDADAMLFNCANGTIDLHTGERRPHDPVDLITKLSPVAFDANAPCPTWEKFLARILPDDELRAYVQRCIGYALTADVSEQVLFFLHGHGSNGKSTFLTALQHVFGDYGRQAAADLLLATNGEPHPTAQAGLIGSRLVVCQEVEQGRSFAEKTIKSLTGGDIISARFMRQDFFEFKPTHKIFLAANHKPKVRGTDHAIWRRIKLIPFDQTIEKAEIDKQLPKKLEAEAAGILAWCVRGCAMWKAQGLGDAAEVVQATQHYRADQDLVALFLSDLTDAAADGFASSSELYRAYVKWCEDSGEKPWSGRALSNALVERGHATRKQNGVRGFSGLRMRPQSRAAQVSLAPTQATQQEAKA